MRNVVLENNNNNNNNNNIKFILYSAVIHNGVLERSVIRIMQRTM